MSRPADHAIPARRPWRRRLTDRLIAADPGLTRTRSALRSLCASALAGGLAAGLLTATDRSVQPAAIAVSIGLLGVLTLPPALPRVWAPAAIGVGIVAASTSALLGETPAGYAAAMAVTVAAAWASRWGPAGASVGFMGFIVSLLSLRIGYSTSDVPGLIVAVVSGVLGVLATVRFLIADRPDATAERLRRCLLAQLSVLVDAVERLAAAGPGRRRQRRARLRLVAVQETALALDRVLADNGENAASLRGAVLDVEALADHLLWSVLTIAPDAPQETRTRVLDVLRQHRIERDDDSQDTAPLVPRLVGSEDRFDEVVRRLSGAARQVRLAPLDLPARVTSAPLPPRSDSGRLAFKTGLAAVPTLLIGLQIARTEWYWGVIAAYIVVTTTASRGEGLRKAAERMVGTVIGVLAGLWIASLLAGRGTLVLAALIGVLAGMVWIFRVNYTLFTFALTIAIALLYQVTGILTVEVLALRVAETAVGVVIASLVVTLVMPISSRAAVDDVVAALLAELDSVLAGLASHGRVDATDVRGIDDAVSAVRQATAPFVTGMPLVRREDGRAARLLATAIRVRIGALGTATRQSALPDSAAAGLSILRHRLAHLRAAVEDPTTAQDVGDRSPVPLGPDEIGTILRAIDDRLTGYGTSRGLQLRDDPGALAGGTGRLED